MSTELKQNRGRQLAVLTRILRRAFVLIEAKGSRTQLSTILTELDSALNNIEEVNDSYIQTLSDENEMTEALGYFNDAETQHREAQDRIQRHLTERKNEAPSVVSSQSGRSSSHVSRRSTDARLAEVKVRVKQLEAEQLQKRLEQERVEQDMQRTRRQQEAQDACVAARLQAELTKVAEDELELERRGDFADEPAAEPQSPRQLPDREIGVATAIPETSHHVQSLPPKFVQSLPRLKLSVFDGTAAEWPKWYALFKSLVYDQPSLSTTEKIIHLQASVSGLAERAIRGMLYDGDLFEEALDVLRQVRP